MSADSEKISSQPPRVLIAASADFVGVSRLPRVLHAAGIHVSILSHPKFLLHLSRYVQARYPSDSDRDKVAQALCQLLQNGASFDGIVLADDNLLKAVANRAAEPWARALLPIDATLVPPQIVFSKAAFLRALGGKNLPLAKSSLCSSPDEIRAAARQSGFPLILKEEFGYSGSGVQKLEDMESLNACLQARPPDSPACIVQEYIEGGNLTVDALFDRGRLRAWACSRVMRTGNGPFGSSTARRFEHRPELEPAVSDMGRLTGAHGLLGLDFIQHERSGKSFLLEVNFRPTAGHALGAYAGFDFGAKFAAQLKHEPAAAVETVAQNSKVFPMFPEDWDRSLTDKDWVSIMKWICWPPYWRHMPWNDPPLLRKHAFATATRLAGWPKRAFQKLSSRKK